MEAALSAVQDLLLNQTLYTVFKAALILITGVLLSRLVRGRIPGLFQRLGLATYVGIGRVTASWLVIGLSLAAALQQLGFDLSIFLGAAGVLSVAVGFASQTSFSNVISGLFLAMERTFEVGDVIRVGGTTGEVLSVDLLSVKLRTFDNLFVRIPNESLVKGEITNISRFPIRRADFVLDMPHGEDLDKVRGLLMALVEQQPLAMVEPPAIFQVLGSNDLGVQVQFSVWAARQHFLEMRTEMQIAIRRSFAAAGVRPPFPRRILLHEGGPEEPACGG